MMMGSDLVDALFFFQKLGHGMDGNHVFPGNKSHAFEFTACFDQVSHRVALAGDYQPSPPWRASLAV